MRVEHIGDATLYLGDCMDILPTLGKVDAVVTDPPYGINYDPSSHTRYNGENNGFDAIANDDIETDLSLIFSLDCEMIIWGAENLYRQLPHRGRWICWHKRSYATKPNSMPSGDFELAWMNKKTGFYKYVQVIHGGVINADSLNGNNEPRFHPTQKPVKLLEFCIELVKWGTILDPFMGSGTTGVACANLGRKFIGIEIEPKYFDIACKRIEIAYSQPRLPFEEKREARQGDLL